MRNSRVVLSFLIALSLAVLYYAPSFAATIITDWNTAKTQYPGSTAGNLGDAAGGIVWSRHNLSTYGWPLQAVNVNFNTTTFLFETSVATTEICVFCHTPHFGRTDTAPMWNRGSAVSASGYVAYGTSAGTGQTTGKTLAGTETGVGGSSLACLSCHDGVTTLDNLINKPGKGSRTNGTGADQGWYFGEIGTGDTIGDTASGGDTPGGAVKANSRLNIGAGNDGVRNAAAVDLSNDHPIGVVYYGDPTGVKQASLRSPDTVISSIAIYNARDLGGANPDDGGSTTGIYGRSDNLWAVRGFIRDDADITSLLREGNMVQCASCHAPHYKNQTNNDPAVVANAGGDIESVENDGLFLRRVGGNSNSGVCRTCHNK